MCYDPSIGLHNGLGGTILKNHAMIVWQFGPMFVASLLARDRLSRRELAIWAQSELSTDGGIIASIKNWTGRITNDCANVLKGFEVAATNRMRSMREINQ
ncbi:MAG TPA: hypothetical protein VHV55_20705 [Pirellulales bacterium]|nr:hypothetical protein [Pirellulales bacterium]